MARTQQVKEKGNAHTTEYEKDTPVETQGFYVYFFLPTKFCLRNAARYFVALTFSFGHVRFVRSRQESRTLLVWLAFPYGRAGKLDYVCILNGGAILRRACVPPTVITAKVLKNG